MRGLGAHLDRGRIAVDPLPRQDVPIVEAYGVALEMPLADERRFIAGLAEQLRECPLRAVELFVVPLQAVQMAVLAGEDGRPARRADAVRTEAVRESHASRGEPIEVGRRVNAAAVAAQGVCGVVVGHDEYDVWPGCRCSARQRPLWQSRGRHADAGGSQEIASRARSLGHGFPLLSADLGYHPTPARGVR